MTQLSIKAKLWLLVITLLCVLTAVSGVMFRQLYVANAGLGSVHENQVMPLKQMSETASGYTNGVLIPLDRVSAHGISPTEAARLISAGRDQADKSWNAFLQTRLFANEQVVVDRIQPLKNQADLVISRIIDQLREGAPEQASALRTAELDPLMGTVLEGIESISDMQLINSRETTQESATAMRTTMRVIATTLTLSLVACIAAALLLIRKITASLNHAVCVAERVARGDLSAQIDTSGGDEIARLLRALATMNGNLMQIVSRIREGSESVMEGVQQIAAGNNDLSQRTEEQATNLEQTAASMEQLAATVHQNSYNARQATLLSSNASTTAAHGGEAMQRVNKTMAHISDSSTRMAAIIDVIDSIAFQTNILALNAAVEAARAGEHGRSFAVVASEVRSLAGRSAEAAKEINALISQSATEVSNGAKLVNEATRTIEALSLQVRDVAVLVDQISTATVEQSDGIAQISSAVMQLDQVTQQNAALVEESAAAASGLSQQANALTQLVATFKLDAEDDDAALRRIPIASARGNRRLER
ncbi:methyl-accepting chemotaxis protein [Diaphorobacter aerolatus]|uniref:MCP four helix bundle domain-containing protein n=1 Tax=Diaphorobacter aerolatus TaxID=1288495 RepID=A0A7H0GKM9_9BURK|nr:methyl-accepting chemotaxis protein [Diaphorobacter aerolatus]QNP48845.1 MCP four helix bundle domain-containing protein [Diaphorobacter aerolatus]